MLRYKPERTKMTNVNYATDEAFGPIVIESTKDTGKRNYTATTTSVEYVTKYGTKAAAIRGMYHKEHMKIGQIADLLNIRYQHVRNTVKQVLKKG